jgi:putative phosphoesterase
MKALILSDLHANIHALEAIWAREHDSDLIYCAGDLVDYGVYPNAVLAWVREHSVICVQGNHDREVIHHYRAGERGDLIPLAERKWAHYNAGLLGEDEIAFLEQLPLAVTFALDGIRYGLTHLYRNYNEIVSLYAYNEFRAVLFANGDGPLPDRLIFGHTHRQCIRHLSDCLLWLNPGSISYRRPDDPDQSAHYATITDGVISLRRVDYDLEPVWRALRAVPVKVSEAVSAERFFPLDTLRLNRIQDGTHD